ncbi:MAG: M20/M25/M40 family metallo-hydrolase [Desulfopila sp.]
MHTLIQRERLATTFIELCEIDSPSRQEGRIAAYLRRVFTALGADSIVEDHSAAATGSESGNLIIRFNATLPEVEGVFFSCHMDTVEPGEGVTVDRSGDIFTSRGATILGGDDKSGIAALIEMMTVLRENALGHGLIEIVITTCEEIGLCGAKHLEHRLVQAKYGYALDTNGIDRVIIGAPAANKFKIEITGVAAHAGLNPEDGVSAIQVAAQAISRAPAGRIDEETTANFGLVKGGVATNIVPEKVVVEGEVRSHNQEKLNRYTAEIEAAFTRTAATWTNDWAANTHRPRIAIDMMAEYPAMRLALDAPVIARIREAGQRLGRKLDFVVAGGGSDANIFNSFGLATAIVATGMDKVHTTDEQLHLDDLVSVTELILGVAAPPRP